jgi:signal transduction histidine kinase
MKIRIRLTIWYFVVTFLILIIFSYGIFLGMRHLVYRALDKDLFILINTIERSFDPFLGRFGILQLQTDSIDRFAEFYLIIYSSTGKPIYASYLAQKISLNTPPLHEQFSKAYMLKTNIQGNIPFIRTKSNGEVTFRVIVQKLYYENNPIGWVTVGLPLVRMQDTIEKLQFSLVFAIIISVGLIAVGGYFLTQKALNPVEAINLKANQISYTNLKERIEIQNPKDELGQLSLTLNNLFERLQRAFESQQQFLSDAAHELKTPLAILRAHWESELNNPELPLPIKEKFVHDIETITRLNHLINNLLLLSKSETFQSDFECCPLRLDEVLKGVIDDAIVLAENKSQKIEVVELQEVMVQGDKIRLYQLFFNLVDNAMKYSPEESTIWISLHKEEPWAVVKVRDNGAGIAAEHLPHIFERFYRVEKDRARKTGGSGLGLAICKLIAERHQGSIEVESTVGKGTVFTVKLPIHKIES